VTPVGFLLERFDERRDATAIVAGGDRHTFGELAAAVGDLDSRLAARGVGAGAVVAFDGDFTPAGIALLLALLRRGTIVVAHRAGSAEDSAPRDELAQVELRCHVDSAGSLAVEPTGRDAVHPLYDQLRHGGRPGLVQFSSGTSGEPKAAVHDAASLLERYERRGIALTTLAFLLFDHLGGIITALRALAGGATLVAPDDRSPDAVCRLVERHAVELLPVTPTFLNLLLLSGADKRHDLTSLRLISYGAEPMPAGTLARVRAALPDVRLRQTYGMVEVGALGARSRADDSLWVRIGEEGCSARVVDGKLQVRTPSMLLGYLNAPTPMTADGWFETGDVVERDGNYLRILGRGSDLINVGGEKVYPAEVEGVIEAMDEVAEATVHGERNFLVGEIVCARVTPAGGGSRDGLERRVRRFCGERLERFKVPVKVEVVAGEAPSTRVKKVRDSGSGPA
jgi:long-chain acyl-CoA synthetase